MAIITPIDAIKGISGKYGSDSNDYFATNKTSNRIRLAKLAHPFEGPATEKQLAQQSKFAERQVAANAWLYANRPSEANGSKGSMAYQLANKLKRTMHLSNIKQVVFKYMDENGNVKLPEAHPDLPDGEGGQTGGNGGGGVTPSPEPGGDEDPSQPSL